MEAEVISETTLAKPTFEMDVEVKLPKDMPKVEHNLDKLEAYAIELEKWYKTIVIRKEDVKSAEAEKTKVNKLIEQVKRLRIDNIKKYKEPIEDFEKTAKSIEALLSNAKDTIQKSLTKYEDERKEEKLVKVINPIITSLISEAFCEGYLIDSNLIEQDKRWFNKTAKDSDIEKDIKEQVDNIINEQKQINEGIEIINKTIALTKNKNLNNDMYIERLKYTKDLTSVLSDIERDNKIKTEESNNIKGVFGKPVDTTNYISQDPFANNLMVTFKGNEEQVKLIREYAESIGMEEL